MHLARPLLHAAWEALRFFRSEVHCNPSVMQHSYFADVILRLDSNTLALSPAQRGKWFLDSVSRAWRRKDLQQVVHASWIRAPAWG